MNIWEESEIARQKLLSGQPLDEDLSEIDDWDDETADINLGGDDSDEESFESQENDNEFLNKKYNSYSIVPDGITKIRIVALLLDNKVFGYRIKTDKGYFDMSVDRLVQYGIQGFKVEKAIRLSRFNGLIVSQSEITSKRCVPDISNNDEDCQKIMNYIFTCY